MCAQLLLQFYADSLKLLRSTGQGLKTCMWFGYNPQIRFCHFFRNLNLVFFSGINTINICRQYVPCMDKSPINFTFSDDSVFLKKILAGDINSLNLLVSSAASNAIVSVYSKVLNFSDTHYLY